MIVVLPRSARLEGPRSGCRGVVPLTARLEPWQRALCRRPTLLAGWLERYGSPLNILDPSPMAGNAGELRHAASGAGVDLGIFFARKANKTLALVDEALELGLGVDAASERELRQALQRNVPGADIVVTAAIKPRPLLELCVDSGATVAIDNEDELELLAELAGRSARRVPIALRLAPLLAGRGMQTRFGLGPSDILAAVDRHCPADATAAAGPSITGVHFHLAGYDATERVDAIAESIELIDALRVRGHEPVFLDIGGGIPMSYLDDEAEWKLFWREHRAALLGRRGPLTFDGHGLGMTAHGGEIVGRANVYPAYQRPTREDWLRQILGAPVAGTSVADALRARGLELRCEPGRSLVDGCGLTAAHVEFRKQRRDGTWLIGLAMNRTQCRSTADDFLLDPLLLRPQARGARLGRRSTGPIEGYLVGAYCIERELLTWRRMRFPAGVQIGDVVVFANTAGYMMHILESASHQIALARNLIVNAGASPYLDAIES